MLYEKRYKTMFCAIFYVLLAAPVSFGMENISPGEVKSPKELPIPDVEKLVIVKFISH